MGTVIEERNRVWQKAESNAIQTKGGGGFTTVLQLDTKSLARGRYRVSWNCEARLQAGSTSVPTIRVREVGGAELGRMTFKSADQNWDGRAGWDFRRYGESATPSFELQVRRVQGTGNNIVEVRRLKLSIEIMNDENAEEMGDGGMGRTTSPRRRR